ncbi:MAG: flagellar biosynthetic protein FliR [Spirochaetales bacterium]|nr:flagellar biosynthetic protein FliR [Spirochaetales bacterium]
MVEVAPLLSSSAIPQTAKIGLSLFAALAVYPWVYAMGFDMPASIIDFFLLIIGEMFIGIIIGFFLAIIYVAFQVAGRFFSLQMGFGASSVFDPLAQIEVPLMGQLLNIIGMFAFISIGGFQKVFLTGVYKSFKSIRAIDLATGKPFLMKLFVGSLGKLFESALTIAFPILGTLFIVSVCMGLLAKAAPQMNLLMLGFPIAIGVAFLILFFCLPFLVEACAKLIDISFRQLLHIYQGISGGG